MDPGFLQVIKQSFGCTYACIWSFLPRSYNCLVYLNGFYEEENKTQPSSSSSSSASLASRLFYEYRQLSFSIEDGLVPGHAFKNNVPCLELHESQLQTHASAQIQRQFYVAARIKTSVFLGSPSGEIEFGFADVTQVNIPMIMADLNLGDSRFNQSQISPSSPSLNSISTDSPECSSLKFNIPNTTDQIINPEAIESSFSRNPNNIPSIPNTETEEAIITSAILAVLSNSPSSSSSQIQEPIDQLPNLGFRVNSKASAFKKYATSSNYLDPRGHKQAGLRRQCLMKKAITFFRCLNLKRVRERTNEASRTINSQLLHMISERKRREKLQDSFQALRTLLPPGTKKDRASLLTTTREYLTSLKAQVKDLSEKNQAVEEEVHEDLILSNNERFRIRISHVPESTSGSQIIDLQITTSVRADNALMVDLAIHVLEFLKEVKNVSLISMEAKNQIRRSNGSSVNLLMFRLSINRESEWDESTFEEAVRRIVADLEI